MKHALTALLLAGLLAVGGAGNAKAFEQEDMQGDPMDNPDHFIWSVFAQLQSPTDPACGTIMMTTLSSAGVPAGQISGIAAEACEHIAEMRTEMESEMDEDEDEYDDEIESMETNLFDATDWHNVQNLYFQHSTNGVVDGRISFSQPIDFMSYDFMRFMTQFGEAMEVERGIIGLDADIVGGMENYGATLTMYNVPAYNNPAVLVDGHRDTSSVVSNFSYDKTNRTITFSARHFTTFKVVEKAKIKKLAPRISGVAKTQDESTLTLTITGSNLDEKAAVRLNNVRASSVKLEDNNTLVATFSLSKLKAGKKYELAMKNSNKKNTTYKKRKITI